MVFWDFERFGSFVFLRKKESHTHLECHDDKVFGLSELCIFVSLLLIHYNLLILGLDQYIRLFEYSFGGLAFDFQFEIGISNILFFFFFWTPGIPRETVLNLSAWLNICTSNRPFANERRSCWPIACIYFMKKSSISYKPHIYIWNNELKRAKDATCERILCYHKTECDACVFFLSTVPRCERKSWISVQ